MVYQILALFIWSSAFVAAKYTFTMMDTILMIQVRLLMAAIIVMPLFFRRWKGVSKLMRKQLWWLGFFNYTATFLLQFIGLKYTSAASATTMIGLEPFMCDFYWAFFLSRSCEMVSLVVWRFCLFRRGHFNSRWAGQ